MRDIITPEVEVAVARLFNPRQCIIVPNISFGAYVHECDVFILKPSGYAVEVEIKMTKADLKADLKKAHKHKSKIIRELYFAIPRDKIDEWSEFVPAHAGIIGYYKYEYLTRASIFRSAVVREDSRKLTLEEKFNIARLGCMRIWNLKQTLNNKIRGTC